MKVKQLREKTGLSQSKFAKIFGMPTSTIQQWETEFRHPKDYIVDMMEKILVYEGYIITDERLECK